MSHFWADTGSAVSINHKAELSFLHYNKLLQNQPKPKNNKHPVKGWNMENKRKKAITIGAHSVEVTVNTPKLPKKSFQRMLNSS